MLSNFFQTIALPPDQLFGNYDLRLVALSFLVAFSASYIALDLTGRLREIGSTPTSKRFWLMGGAVAMGAGIWSMHFIGMLSFTIPGLTLRYDLFWTVLSLLVAIFASGFALYLLQNSKIRLEHYIIGGTILGLAIASMHYTGMEGMLISLNIKYLPSLFFLSVLIAIVASEAAIWLALKSSQIVLRLRNRVKIASALIMGIAICGMHYVGMAASVFSPLCEPVVLSENISSLDPALLAMGIAGMTFVILGIAFIASSSKDALNQRQLEKARQLGMAEISASVLHNVGNVLNSVNVSAHTVLEKINNSKVNDIEKINALLVENKDNLPDFLTKDPRGAKVLEYMGLIAKHLSQENQNMTAEMDRLKKNVSMIEDIISTQQVLSKTTEFEQILSINELLDEALMITGLNIRPNFDVVKKYQKLPNITMDKVKLLQVLVNIIQNAKESVIASTKEDKKIEIKTLTLDSKIKIEIKDNGLGIPAKTLDKIFTYGFTTKEKGHGFGLHSCSLTINELGGKILVESPGLDKGATFILELPIREK